MPDRPNIIVLMTDQQRGDCLSADGHPVLMTPNMDAIGGAGARFSRAYSTCPVCVPARRSFLSGQFPATHGTFNNAGNEWEPPATLPGVLSSAGYQTFLVGRSMHQSPPRKRYGFDQMTIYDHRIRDDDYDVWLSRREPEGSGGYQGTGVMHNDWTARPWHMDEAYHRTNWTVNQALRFLETRDPACPYFLVVSFVAPHPPLVPPAFYMERYLRQELPAPFIGDWATPPANDGIGDDVSAVNVHLRGEALRSCRAAYYGLINHIDDQIRRLLNPVTGLHQDDAIVIFLSDHGEMLGDHYLWRKSLPYEGSARIPLLVRAPHRFGIQGGTVVDRPVGIEDVMPTLLDMAGVEIPDSVDGQSLLPLMRGENVSWRDHLHIENSPIHHTLTDGREKYIWFVADGREQFFDLTSDPTECHNLIDDPLAADRLAHWRTQMIEELRDRPEGFSDGTRLIAGRKYASVLPQ